MDYADKLVTQAPLYELWNTQGPIQAMRGRFLNSEEIKEILRTGPVRFAVACVCDQIQWIPIEECYEFWKTVRPNITNEESFYLEDFPGEFAYVAIEWKSDSDETIILLEMSH